MDNAIVSNMKTSGLLLCPALLALACGPGWSQPYGLSNRVQNTTLRLPPAPPVIGYATSNAFPGLSFTDPVAIAAPPGETNRLFIVEQTGRIIVITNLAEPRLTVFMDIAARVRSGGEQGLLGLAFHPGYRTNRYFFIFYTVNTNGNQTFLGDATRHDRLSRFQISESDPNQGTPASEVVLINQRDEEGNHNGGDLHFGPDEYLYVSLGDEGDANDSRNNSQRIDRDYFAGILRIDVDKRSGSLAPNPHPAVVINNEGEANYAVPPDNPFVGATSFNGQPVNSGLVRTEFWAVGLRNPWRMSFDPVTGWHYCGDVGQDRFEEIDIIVKGGNYGWAFREGNSAGPKPMPANATAINPILNYGHGGGTNQGNSVTGGRVYRGDRFPDLHGRYVFADYVSGNVWSLLYNGTNASEFHRLTSEDGIAGFGTDPRNGDILLADLDDGAIKRLERVTVSGGSFPETLAQTGAFANLATLIPNAGIVGYDVNLPFWSDNAEKTRWFYIPVSRTITFRATNNWTYPTGSVWIKHFELELTNGVPESKRRLETRFIVRYNDQSQIQRVYGLTYRWDDTQTNATLVADGGLDETFPIYDGGTVRTQIWHYPSRAECLECHTGQTQGGLALGFNTPQLHRDFTYDNGVTDNQIRALAQAGYFIGTVPSFHSLRAMAHPTNEQVSVEQRVRSYLAVNCSSCHQPRGSALGTFNTRFFSTPLSELNLINGTLVNSGGNPTNRVVVPGSIEHSMLLTRLSIRGPGQMPPLDSTLIDTQAVALINRWITDDLIGYRSFADWQIANFGSMSAPEAQPNADPDGDRGINSLEYLTDTSPVPPLGANEVWGISVERSGDLIEVIYPRLANRGFEVQWTTNLANRASWQFLSTLDNRPYFASTNGETRVADVITNGPPKFYRVRVYEP